MRLKNVLAIAGAQPNVAPSHDKHLTVLGLNPHRLKRESLREFADLRVAGRLDMLRIRRVPKTNFHPPIGRPRRERLDRFEINRELDSGTRCVAVGVFAGKPIRFVCARSQRHSVRPPRSDCGSTPERPNDIASCN